MNFANITNFVNTYATNVAVDILTNSKNKNILSLKPTNTIKSITGNVPEQNTTVVGYLKSTLESVNYGLCTYVLGMSYVDKRNRTPEDVIYVEDALKAGISSSEVDRMKQFLWKKVENAGDISGIYLTPSASFSDSCFHSEEEVKSNRLAHRSCHLNGVAYLIGPQTRLKEIIDSEDIYGSIAIFNISSFGSEIDAIMKTNTSSAMERIEKVVELKLNDIREKVAGMFVLPFEKTAAPVFDNYKTVHAHGFEEKLLKNLRASSMKIAGYNGFIMFGTYDKAPDPEDSNYKKGKSVSKVFLAIRSYDENTSKELFKKIYDKNPTLTEFKNSEELTKLRDRAKNNLLVHQGRIAYEIIKNILNWSTPNGEQIRNFETDSTESKLIHFPCLMATARLHYNAITELSSDSTVSSRSRSLYHDHCFTTHDISQAKFWPYFRSREKGISLVIPKSGRTLSYNQSLLSEDKWKITFPLKPSRLPVLPMGCRKKLHRDDYTLDSYLSYFESDPPTSVIASYDYFDETQDHQITMNNSNKVWYGQGDVNMKLLSGKYPDSEDEQHVINLVNNVYETHDLDVIDAVIWFNDFVQEFTDANQHTLNIIDVLYLTHNKDTMVLDFYQKIFEDNSTAFFQYAEKTEKLVPDWMPLQGGKLSQITKDNFLNYIILSGRLNGKEFYLEPATKPLIIQGSVTERQFYKNKVKKEISVR